MVARARSSRLERHEMSAAQLVISDRASIDDRRILAGLAVRLAMGLGGSILRIASEEDVVVSAPLMGSSLELQSRDARDVTSSSPLTCSQGRSRSPLILK